MEKEGSKLPEEFGIWGELPFIAPFPLFALKSVNNVNNL